MFSRISTARPRVGLPLAIAVLTTVGLGATAGGAFAADAQPCSTPTISDGSVAGTDANVNVFVGGDFAVRGAAEAEGVVVVAGSLSTTKDYNVGVAGGGSRVTPPSGSVMLRVGGDVSGSGTVRVGDTLPGGGGVLVGGTVVSPVLVTTNGGTFSDHVGDTTALGEYADFAATLAPASAGYAELTDTGRVDSSGPTTTLDGDGTASQQVFTITDPSLLGTAAHPVQIEFDNIPSGATVIVNVEGDVDAHVTSFATSNGLLDQNGPGAADLAYYASHTLWNIEADATPTISGGAQWAGSILVPTAGGDTTIDVPGVNGRTYVAGDLTHTKAGGEFHNYPFVGSSTWTCSGNTTTPPATPAPGTPSDTVTPPPSPATNTPASTPSRSAATSPAPASTSTPGSAAPSSTPATAASAGAAPASAPTTVVEGLTVTASPSADNSTAAAAPAASSQGILATTGANVLPWLIGAILLIGGGVALVVVRRRAA